MPFATRVAVVSDTAELLEVDGRLRIARRFRDIANAISTDRPDGSEVQQQLVRRFAATAVLAERLEVRLARGEEIDKQEHALLCATLCRLAGHIGVTRTPRLIEPLAGYLERTYAPTAKGRYGRGVSKEIRDQQVAQSAAESELPEPETF